jgi:hypothetical protein
MDKCLTCGQNDELKLTFCSKCRQDYCNRCIVVHESLCVAASKDYPSRIIEFKDDRNPWS